MTKNILDLLENDEYSEKFGNDPIFRTLEINKLAAEYDKMKRGYHWKVYQYNLNSNILHEYYFYTAEEVKQSVFKQNSIKWMVFEENKHLKEEKCIIS